MNATPGGGSPSPGVRASDAERDATVERLSAAAGEGRLTLEEFSQRMERATVARTRAELASLTADLPADAAGRAPAAASAPTKASWHVSPVGSLRVTGPWHMDPHMIVIAIVGGARLDLSQAELAAPEVTVTNVSLVGGVRMRVPPGVRVEVSGFTLIGGTSVERGPEPGPGAPTVHVRAFSLVGGVRIRRGGPGSGDRDGAGRPGRQADLAERADWRAERRAERADWRAQRRAERADWRAERRSLRRRARGL